MVTCAHCGENIHWHFSWPRGVRVLSTFDDGPVSAFCSGNDGGPHEEGPIRCQVCKAHPGWAHGDESARSEPLDVCKACLGSGTREVLFTEVSASLLFSLARRYTNDATEAGKDEAERDMRLAVLRLANVAAALQYLVTNW